MHGTLSDFQCGFPIIISTPAKGNDQVMLCWRALVIQVKAEVSALGFRQ